MSKHALVSSNLAILSCWFFKSSWITCIGIVSSTKNTTVLLSIIVSFISFSYFNALIKNSNFKKRVE